MSDEDDPGIAWALLEQTRLRVDKAVDTGDNPRRGDGRIPPRRRTITVDGHTFVAIEANDLLEYDSLGNYGRPGQPYQMHPSLVFVRLCCVKCRSERVVVAFWADDPDGWCDHGKLCPWAEHDDHEHGALSLSLVPVSRE